MAKIVIVEDDDATRAGYRELLNLAGHEVIATSTYQEGRHAVQVESPDLVIADLRLGASQSAAHPDHHRDGIP